MKRLVLRHINMTVLLGLGLLPLLWFRPGYDALAGFDFAVYFDPVGVLSKSRYLWSDLMAGGYDISHEVSSAPYYLLFSLPVLAGSSLYGAEKFVFCFLFALQGLSMSYMLNSLHDKNPGKGAIALTGAIIYSLSFPVMAHFGRGNLMALLAYGLLPFLIGMLYRGFKDKAAANRYVAGIALLSLPIAATKGHPADFVVLFGVAALFTLFHAFTAGREGLRILSFAAKALAASVLVNLWWIAPNIHYMSDFGLTKADLVKEGFYNLETLSYYSSGKSVLKTLLNNSLDLWFDVPGDVLLNPSAYASPLFIALGLFTPIAGSMALIRGADRNIFFFSALFLAAVFMSKGSSPPLGDIFERMYMNIPGFFLFRAPYRVFSSLMAFSVTTLAALVAGSAAWRLLQDRRPGEPLRLNKGSAANIIKAAALFIFLAGVALYSWPLFTGSHLREKGTLREPGVFHSLPEDYALAGEWLKKAGNGSKLYIPYEVYDANARWGYSGPDPSYELISAPKAVARPNGTVYLRYQRPIERLNALVRDWGYGDLKKVLAFYNIRYVMLNGHLSPWVFGDANFNEYLKGLLDESGLVLRKRFGAISLYENEDNPGRVYGAAEAYILSGDERALPALSLAGYLERPFFVMAKDMPLDGLASFMEFTDGVIFHNSNLIDLICESAKAGFSAAPKGAGFTFKSKSGVAYELYAKGGPEMTAIIGGKPLRRAEKIEHGFSWKGLGEFSAAGGEHSIIVTGPRPQHLVVLPKGLPENLRRKFAEAGSRGDFETAYLFDVDTGEGEITVEGAYEAAALSPNQFRRAEEDALKDAQWAFDVERRTYSANVDVELGKYPRLAVEGLDKKKLSSLTLFYTVDENNGLERLVLDDSAFGQENEAEVSSVLKKRHPEASLFTLRSVKAAYSAALQRDERPSLRLLGSFGAVKYCPSERAIFRLGELKIAGGNCGEWSRQDPITPGKYAVKGSGGVATAVLLLSRPGKMKKEAPEVSYARQDPTRYFVLAEQKNNTRLVFGDSYNAGWSLRDGDRSHGSIKVNGYANGFLPNGGKKEFQLEYSPQRLFDLSKLISAVSLAGVAALGLYSIKK